MIPKESDIVLEVLHENHDANISGHLGIDKLYNWYNGIIPGQRCIKMLTLM